LEQKKVNLSMFKKGNDYDKEFEEHIKKYNAIISITKKEKE